VWSRPFTLAGPYGDDLLPPQIAFSPQGDATVGFGVFNEQYPWISRGVITTRAASGKISGPRPVPNAKEILSLSYDGQALELLTGASPANVTCCGSAWGVQLAHGKFGGLTQLVSDIQGATFGGLVGFPKTRMLAAIATDAGVWVDQSLAPGRFRGSRVLTPVIISPQALASAPLRGGRSALAWTATSSADPNTPASAIFLATGTPQRAPQSARLAVRAPSGYGIDELGLAGGAGGPTGAWTESWVDRSGNYHSQVAVADLKNARPVARTLPVAGQLASGLTLVADARGDELLAWETCDVLGTCSVRAASRSAGHRFGAPQRLGSVDPGEAPAAALSPSGEALVAWISGGRVVAADRRRTGGRLGPPVTVAKTTEGSSVTVAFGPGGQALAAWAQGIATPMLRGAFLPSGH
jgi:hypothetical protein